LRKLTRHGKPGIDSIAIADGYSLVSWHRGEHIAGQAVLRKQPDGWKILSYGGGALGFKGLRDLNIPNAENTE